MSDEQPTSGPGGENAGNVEGSTGATGATGAVLEDRVAGSIKKRGCGFYAGVTAIVVLVIVVLTAALTAWWYNYNFNAKPFKPVELSQEEQAKLDEKLEIIGVEPRGATRGPAGLDPDGVEGGGIRPVPPQGEDERLEQLRRDRRTVVITEKEINAILNHNTNLEERVRIRFYDGALGAEANVPVPPDAPFLGGRTLRGKVRLACYMEPDGGLAIICEDVTAGGVPLPNAWLGGIKGENLVGGARTEDPFLRAFADGIEEIEIVNGEIRIRLAE